MKESWEYKKLGEVCDVRDGTHDSPQYRITGIPLITSKNLINGKIDFSNVNYISEIDAANINKRSKVDIGDIIMPMIGTIGNPIINNSCNYFCIKNVALIKFLNNFISNKFVYYILSSELFINYVKKNNKGGTQKFLALSLIRELPIPVPPLSEQKRIVEELDLISGIIEKQKQQLKELDTLAQSIFYYMFGDPVTNEKGWEVKKMKEVAPSKEFIGEITKVNNKYWLLNLDKVESNTGKILSKDYYDITEIGSSTITFDESNILYSKLRPYLNKVVIPYDTGYGTSELVPLKPKYEILNRIFLAHLLRSKPFVSYISVKVAGAKMPRVSMEDLRNFKVILPPLALQNLFASKIEAIEKQKEAITKSIEETQKLFDYTMDKYFG